jgi:hypothetical protein
MWIREDRIKSLVIREVCFPKSFLDGVPVVRCGVQFGPEANE